MSSSRGQKVVAGTRNNPQTRTGTPQIKEKRSWKAPFTAQVHTVLPSFNSYVAEHTEVKTMFAGGLGGKV